MIAEIILGVLGVLLQISLLVLLLREKRSDDKLAAVADDLRKWLTDARRITDELEQQVKQPTAYHTRPQR